MITYLSHVSTVTADQLQGFFVDWPDPPSPETHLRILQASANVVVAMDDATGNVVGFVTAISDGVLSAYIPLLEVLPAYQGQGIGTELMRRMLEQLGDLYMIDLLCDPEIQPFYERIGLQRATGMFLRNYGNQGGSG